MRLPYIIGVGLIAFGILSGCEKPEPKKTISDVRYLQLSENPVCVYENGKIVTSEPVTNKFEEFYLSYVLNTLYSDGRKESKKVFGELPEGMNLETLLKHPSAKKFETKKPRKATISYTVYTNPMTPHIYLDSGEHVFRDEVDVCE